MSKPIKKEDGSFFSSLKEANAAFVKKCLDVKKFGVQKIAEEKFQIIKVDEEILKPVVLDKNGNVELGDYPIIRISAGGKGDLKKIPVGANGTMLVIQRGVAVCIPKQFVKVLDDAVEVIYPEVDEDEDAEPIERQRFPYTFIRNGSKADFDKMMKGESIK